jgi:hypothetical protein
MPAVRRRLGIPEWCERMLSHTSSGNDEVHCQDHLQNLQEEILRNSIWTSLLWNRTRKQCITNSSMAHAHLPQPFATDPPTMLDWT